MEVAWSQETRLDRAERDFQHKNPTWDVLARTNVIHAADADPARANPNRESDEEGAACAARADGVILTSLNRFGFDADALVRAWEEPFPVNNDGGTVTCAAYETRQSLDVGAAERQEEPE